MRVLDVPETSCLSFPSTLLKLQTRIPDHQTPTQASLLRGGFQAFYTGSNGRKDEERMKIAVIV